MARKRYQKGTLLLRGSRNPAWFLRWRERILKDGVEQAVQHTEFVCYKSEAATKRLAERKADEHRASINATAYAPRNVIGFTDLAKRWQKTVLVQHKPSSQNSEKTHLKHFVAYFGSLPVDEITPELVQCYVAQPGHPKTIRNHYKTLRLVLKAARIWGYMRDDPCRDIVLPRNVLPKRRVFTLEEIQQILAAAEEPFKTLYWVAAETGARVGELLALRVCDINATDRYVSVRQNASRGRIGTPKSDRGQRTFSISSQLAARLRDYCQDRTSLQLLFGTGESSPWDQTYVVRKLHQILDRLGLVRAGMHAFRHGNATLMDRLGTPIKIRQERLGHSDPNMTLGVYTHIASEDDRRIADQLGQILTERVAATNDLWLQNIQDENTEILRPTVPNSVAQPLESTGL